MASMRELSEQILGQTILNKETEDYMMTPRGPIRRPAEAVEVEESVFSRPLDMEGRFSMLPLRDVPGGEREFALPLPLAEMMNVFTAPGRALTQSDFDPEQEALDFALGVTGGSAAGTAPVGSLAMGVPRIQLPRGVERPGAVPEMDDRKFMQPKMEEMTIDAERVQFEKPAISLADYEGKNALVTMTDRTPAGDVIYGARGVEFNEPLPLQGGQNYMFNNPGEVWALDTGGASTVLNRGGDMIVLPMNMATTSVDFPTMAPAAHMRYSQNSMNKKNKKYVERLIKKGGDSQLPKGDDQVPIPDFPGIDAPDMDNYLAGLSGPQRKTINNVFNMVANPSPKQIKGGIKKVDGALTNTEMRMIITAPEQLDIPSLMQIENVGIMSGGRSRGPHMTYNTSLSGEGLGRIDRPLTAQDMMPQLFPRSTPDYIDSKDAYTARLGQRTVPIDEKLLRRLGY